VGKRKKIGRGSITGDKGVAFIHQSVLDMGFIWNATRLEAGIDGYIEIRDDTTEEVTAWVIQVQSKAGDSWFKAEDDQRFEFLCDEADLNYWMGGNTPVILVVSRPDNREGYWKSIKDYFRDPERRKARKVHFDKRADRFDASAATNLAKLAMPKGLGNYLSAIPKSETLATNLIKVDRIPSLLYKAKTAIRFPRQVWDKLNQHNCAHQSEWFLFDGSLFSIHDLQSHPWSELCSTSTIMQIASETMANSTSRQETASFVRMITYCTNQLLAKQSVRYHKEHEHYFFQATTDLKERKVGGLSVFKGYPSRTAADRTAYYRHRAMRLQFQRYDGQWYAEVTPSYHFTMDGYAESRFSEQRLSKIKMIERQNKTHLRQVRLWAEVLQQVHVGKPPEAKPPSLPFFDDEAAIPEPVIEPYPHLAFGSVVGFEVDYSIPELAWLPSEDAPELVEDNPESLSTLFQDEDHQI
jgi:hypothetical protein